MQNPTDMLMLCIIFLLMFVFKQVIKQSLKDVLMLQDKQTKVINVMLDTSICFAIYFGYVALYLSL